MPNADINLMYGYAPLATPLMTSVSSCALACLQAVQPSNCHFFRYVQSPTTCQLYSKTLDPFDLNQVTYNASNGVSLYSLIGKFEGLICYIRTILHRRSMGKKSEGAQQWRSQDFGSE